MRARAIWLCAAMTAACSNDDWIYRARVDAALDVTGDRAHDVDDKPDASDAAGDAATDAATADVSDAVTADVSDAVTADVSDAMITDAMVDASDVVTADAPDVVMADAPDVVLVDAPDVVMVDAPDVVTLDMPDVVMVDRPDVVTVDAPDVLTVDAPDVLTVDAPDVLTVDMPDVLTVDMPDVLTVDMPDVVDVATDRGADAPDATCPPGFGDCDPRAGCETDLRNDLANCGACGRECVLANATPSCTAGRCAVASCSAGYGDCDGDSSNGCEANFRNDNAHCGACGNACAASNCIGGACVRSRRVFVTSAAFSGNLGGLAGADALCQSAANAATLGGRWRAWLSDATGSPNSRFVRSADPYVLLDGRVLATSYAALTSGTFLMAQVNRDELNRAVTPRSGIRCGSAGSSQAWSTTTDRGDFASFTATDPNLACNNWSVATSAGNSFTGQAASLDRVAVDPVCAGEDCASVLPLMCFEQ